MASPRQSSTPPSQATPTATVIGPGVQVSGQISGEEDLSVQGHVEGVVHLTESLYVAPGGIVVAQVRARDVIVSGIVVGNVAAEDSVVLKPGAKLVGDITAPRVIISDGAAFSGNIVMGGAPPPARTRERRVAVTKPRVTTTPRLRATAPSEAPSRPARRVAASGSLDRPAPREAREAREAREIREVAEPGDDGERHEDETIVVRHAEIEPGFTLDGPFQTKKKGKKLPRVPKPGKRRVTRRS